MTASNDDELKCPGCKMYSRQEQLEAVGMVLTAAEAMIYNKVEEIELAAAHMSALEAHKAVTLYAGLLLDLCEIFDVEPKAYLDHQRADNNARLQEV